MPLSKTDIQAILDEIDLGLTFAFMNADFGYRDHEESDPPNPYWRPNTIRVALWVTDRDSSLGMRTRLHHMVNVESPLETREQVLALARKAIHEVLLHEVDESILVAGVRVFDPHR